MSAIENASSYRCVVSIAGDTDPKDLSSAMLDYVGGRGAAAFIGTGDEVYEQGSPVDRAEEFAVPVLLIHARKDINVPFAQSASLNARCLAPARTWSSWSTSTPSTASSRNAIASTC